MKHKRRVEYEGRTITLRELAKIKGVSYAAVSARYRRGERGEQLWRVIAHPRRVGSMTERAQMLNEATSRRAHSKQDTQAGVNRLQLQVKAQVRAKAERDAEFARPLIDATLLTARERQLIRESIIGRQHWYPMGGVQR